MIKINRLIVFVILVMGVNLVLGGSPVSSSESEYQVEATYNIMVPMRDGVKLSVDVYRPKTNGKFPVLLQRTPYNNYDPKTGYFFASRGYVVVMQDVRGKYDSEGEFYPFATEQNDGYDTQEWAGTQPWSNGSIGTFGGSYVAATQWQAALMQNPHLKAMFPYVGASNMFNGWVYDHGAFELSFNVMWGAVSISAQAVQDIEREPIDWQQVFKILPVSSIPDSIGRRVPWYKDWVINNTFTDYWKQWSLEDKYAKIDVPVFNMGGWYDVFLDGTLNNFNGLLSQGKSKDTRNKQKLVIGPWFHTSPDNTQLGELDFGPNAGMDINNLMLQWFDSVLKGSDTGVFEQPAVKIFVMGKNEWRYENEWPLKRTKYTNFYFHSVNGANSLFGDGSLDRTLPKNENADTFTYDPEYPVPTVGGNNCCEPSLVTEGPYDQRAVERRPDVLVYTSGELQSDLEVTGPISVKLYASTSVENTDFTAKLTDVYPSGKSINISGGILRTIYRNSLEKVEWLEPEKVYEYTINLRPTSNVFLAGHQLRVEISSSNFPRYDRNLNTRTINDGVEMIAADQTIYHNNKYPSCIILPIIPTNEK